MWGGNPSEPQYVVVSRVPREPPGKRDTHGTGAGAGRDRDPSALHGTGRPPLRHRRVGTPRRATSRTGRTAPTPSARTTVEFPVTWSQNSTNIVAQKYFRGTLGTDERETSLRQVIDRVADTITSWGVKDGYFVDESEGAAFRNELKAILVTQRAAFNSPVWFNIGVKGVPQQGSACQPYDALGLDTSMDWSRSASSLSRTRLAPRSSTPTALRRSSQPRRTDVSKCCGSTPRPAQRSTSLLTTSCGGCVDGERSEFVEAGTLRPGDQLEWHRAESWGTGEITTHEMAESALAGWLQSDGFVGQLRRHEQVAHHRSDHRHRRRARLGRLGSSMTVFPDAHRHERKVETQDESLDCRRLRLYGEPLAVIRRSLVADDSRYRDDGAGAPLHRTPPGRGAPTSAACSRPRVTCRSESAAVVVAFDMVSEGIVRGAQQLLARFGIFARVKLQG